MATIEKMRRDASRWSKAVTKRLWKHKTKGGETLRIDRYDTYLKYKREGELND